MMAYINILRLLKCCNKTVRYAILICWCIIFAQRAAAQTTATQTITLTIVNSIAITFTSTGTSTGSSITIPFATVSDYANGVTSAVQNMLVQSNKNFNVSIQSSGTNFTYTGTTTPAPAVSVASALSFLITNNSTGGSLSYTSYASIPSGAATILNSCTNGANQTFSVTYKATPGFAYPAGTYTTSIIYTATQL